MLNAAFRPLSGWPRELTRNRKSRYHFKAGWADTLDVLEKELRLLRAQNIVVEIETTLDDIRNDGWPRSNARVTGPRVAVSFNSRYGPLTYYCDDCIEWQHNMRCIALTLERLRTAEMYGVTKRGEQYQGFKRLPGGIEVGPMAMTLEDAAGYIVTVGGGDTSLIVGQSEYFQKCYRRAAMACHPDRHPALHDEWRKLQEAAEMLKQHHKIG
jgi:hypothetical protein